jgi:acyl-CoA synthetase (AMP-forming)/AMP-acid ligase II
LNIEFLVETTDKQIHEISELVKSVEWQDTFNDGCSKLTFDYLSIDLEIDNGSIVRFRYNGANIFYGVVFKHKHAKNKVVTVTAYDMLRYCKAKDTVVVSGYTATDLARQMCNYFGLTVGTLSSTGYTLTTSVQDSKTWLDIMYAALDDTIRSTGRWFSLRDEFGSICLRNLSELESNLIIGDESLCYDYDYSKSIDEDTYNQIKLAVDNEVTGKRDIYMSKDSDSISKYGLLQYYDVMSFSTTTETSSSDTTTTETDSEKAAKKEAKEAKKKAITLQMVNSLLSLYNSETESLSLDCIGDISIRAGSSFHAYLTDLNLDKRLIVKSATHTFLPVHTMKLEVRI